MVICALAAYRCIKTCCCQTTPVSVVAFGEVDPISMKLLLSGKSYDYGKPKWNFVTGKLYVPKDYEGLRIEYNGDSFVDYVNVSEQFEISYY